MIADHKKTETNQDKASHRVFLGLGSNIGEREENLGKALTALCQAGIDLIMVSSVYESAAVDYEEQPDFLNVVAQVSSRLNPLDLLKLIKAIESELGREPGISKGPRVIDIDILLFDELAFDTKELTIPHPRMTSRSFVLIPLLEIAPEAKFPDGKLVRRLLNDEADLIGLRKAGVLVPIWK